MTWVQRFDALIIWLAGVSYLLTGIGQIMLGVIDGHWLLYSGIGTLLIGLLLLYASTAALRGERPNLVLVGNLFSLLLLPPLGLVGLVLYFFRHRRQSPAQ